MSRTRIYLVGPRGSGKTTVGRAVADRLGWPFFDADAELESRAGMSVADLFRTRGEPAFRDLEATVLRDLSETAYRVVATGGGVILRPENRDILAGGFVARLVADAPILWERMQADPISAGRRPNLTAVGGLPEMVAVLAAREPLYAAVANVVVDATLSPDAAADVILSAWHRSDRLRAASPSES